MAEKIELGQTVVDKVTDFKGIAIARCEYAYETTRVEVQPIIDGDDKWRGSHWIPESRLSAEG